MSAGAQIAVDKILKNNPNARRQDPNGAELGDAPRLVQFGATEIKCCTPGQGILAVPPGGISISLSVAYNGHAGSGVIEFKTQIMDDDSLETNRWEDAESWKVPPGETEISRTRSATHTFKFCVPCGKLAHGPTANIALYAYDEEGNASVQIVGVHIDSATLRNCCGANFKPRGLRPIRVDNFVPPHLFKTKKHTRGSG